MADRARQYLLLADEDLISLVEANDAEAFAVLYDRHNRAAYSLAYRMMGDPARAYSTFSRCGNASATSSAIAPRSASRKW